MQYRKYCSLLIVVFLLSILSFKKLDSKVFGELPLLGKIVFVDPGHGGRDPGTMYKDILEKNINLEISKKLEQKLTELGAIVYMTRHTDEDLSSKWDPLKKRGDLYRRIIMYRKQKADMYLSIHVNWNSSQSLKGPEVLYNKINKNNEILAAEIMSGFKKDLNSKRKIKETDLYMYKSTTILGVLVECGYLSNPTERKILQDNNYQQKIADSIAKSVINYYKLTSS